MVSFAGFSQCHQLYQPWDEVEEFWARFPSITSWMECCYGAQHLLHFGGHTILSCILWYAAGWSFKPSSFALAFHCIVERIKRELLTFLMNVWYLDDGSLCWTACWNLLKALTIVENEGPSKGLFLNQRNHSCLFPRIDDAFDILVAREEFVRLESPIGSPSCSASSALKIVNKAQNIISLLPALNDSQMEATLLHTRMCLIVPLHYTS